MDQVTEFEKLIQKKNQPTPLMLLQKSNENIRSAKLLLDNGRYNSVIHSAYYSCFQLMLYIVNKELDDDIGEGSHNKLISSIASEINRKKLYIETTDFNNNITKLKNKRKLSDYKKYLFKEKESKKVYLTAERFRASLSNIFNIKNNE